MQGLFYTRGKSVAGKEADNSRPLLHMASSVCDVEFCFQSLLQNLGKVYTCAFCKTAEPRWKRYIFVNGTKIVCSTINIKVDICQSNNFAGRDATGRKKYPPDALHAYFSKQRES